MYLIRDVFRCKPGHAKSVAEKFKKTIPMMKKEKGFVSARVLVDFVANYWTVVIENEVASLADFESSMNDAAGNAEFREAVKGYMEEVEGGYREIFRIA
jgi:quinol monooxygenase YgiN